MARSFLLGQDKGRKCTSLPFTVHFSSFIADCAQSGQNLAAGVHVLALVLSTSHIIGPFITC